MRRTPRLRVLGGLSASAVLLMSACGSGGDTAGGNADDGTLTLAIGADMTGLDPAAQNSTSNMQRLRQVVESLTTLDSTGELQPLLATDWEVSEDGMTWTFKLREGVTFSDGEPFNADAVKFSMDRLLSGDVVGGRPDAMIAIDETVVVDDLTVEFKMKEPYAALPAALYQPMAGIVSPASIEQDGNSMESIVAPVGTGPFEFVDYVAGEHFTLTRNDDYWGEKPAYREQVWQVVPEATTRLAMLRSDGADIVFDPPVTDLEALQNDSGYATEMVQLPQAMLLFINQESTPAPELQDVRVRRALSYAVNREQIIEELAVGAGELLPGGPLPSFDFGACDAGNYGYDPEQAKSLIQEAGVEGLKLRMAAPNGRYLNDYAIGQAVAGDLRAVGFDVELAPPVDFPTYLETIYAEDGAASSVDISIIAPGSIFLDGGHALKSYRADNAPPNGYNGGYYENKEFEALYDTALVESDEERRAEMVCEASRMLVDDAAAVWMYAPLSPVVSSSDVEGITPLPVGMIDASTVTLD